MTGREWRDCLYHGGANQNLLDKDGYSVLHKAVKEPDEWWKTWRSDSINWDAVKMLVEFQCDINKPDPHGHTPLQRMIKDNQGEIIKCCTMWGRDVGQAATEWGKLLSTLCVRPACWTPCTSLWQGEATLWLSRDREKQF
ncbi:hypothetical protein BaRGS_00025742 [Batillaria attramentaria]|uniref:Ankyrin repeat protein n=1 Tax=Batillaria attramentaria TaxID=370345 RepID=A0ABD0K7K8_9CAEN